MRDIIRAAKKLSKACSSLQADLEAKGASNLDAVMAAMALGSAKPWLDQLINQLEKMEEQNEPK